MCVCVCVWYPKQMKKKIYMSVPADDKSVKEYNKRKK